MNQLQSNGTIKAWATAPYDWRLDYDTLLSNGRLLPDGGISYLLPPEAGHDPYIIETLKRLALTSRTGKVTIIAHSNGGLLAKALTNKLGAEASQLIDKIIFVDVPQLGTPKAVAGLLHGTRMGIPESFPLLFTETEARYLAQNMPLTYNLLPSNEYFHYVDDSVLDIDAGTLSSWATKYGTTIHSTERLGNFLLDITRPKPSSNDLATPEIANPILFSKAVATHTTLDHWTPPAGVDLTLITGWGEETLSGIGYKKVKTCHGYIENIGACDFSTNDLTLTLNHVIDGDGTVVVPSALWANGASTTRYWVNLNDYNNLLKKVTLSTRKHADILEVPALRQLITHIITKGFTDPPTEFVSSIAPQYDGKTPRLHFTLHSPLTLEFYDSLGNHVGYSTSSGNIDHNISGINYERYGDVQWLSIPKDLAGKLVMHGTGSGSFTLDVEEVNGNTRISTTSFEGIPSSTSTLVTMNITPAQSTTGSSTLVVDVDADGIPDITLEAKQNSVVTLLPPDITPPEALFSFSTSTQALLITGLDASSSSITVLTTATSTTITDASGNTLRIPFLEYKKKVRRIVLTFNKLVYNGSTTSIATTTLKYKWNTNKKGEYTMFAIFIKTASSTTEAHYRPKKNITIIMTKPTDFDDADNDDDSDTRPIKTKLLGLVVLGIQTQKGNINLTY